MAHRRLPGTGSELDGLCGDWVDVCGIQPALSVQKLSILTSSQWFDNVNEARKTLATILGGIVVLAGAYFTWRNIRLLQEGQITMTGERKGRVENRFTVS
jgi:hypothetical protein